MKKSLIISGERFLLTRIDRVFATDLNERAHNRRTGFHDPDYRFPPDDIAFVHVAKSGGTSIHEILRDAKDPAFHNLGRHMPVSRHCPPSRYRYVTVLREPVARVWSLYQMVLRHSDDYPYYRFAKAGIASFLKHCWEVRNMYCRYYAADCRREPDRSTLERAFYNLCDFEAVLEFEDFNEQLKAYLETKGIDADQIPHSRKGHYVPPSDEEAELIRHYNELDIELFEKWKRVQGR